jgi:negative modulator of initiation of replication
MKTIEIDDALYRLLLQKIERFGESPSETIRRLLGLVGSTRASNGHPLSSERSRKVQQTTNGSETARNSLSQYLSSQQFRSNRQVVGRFLSILSFAHKADHQRFVVAMQEVKGRSRKYFGSSASELNATGNSVNPKRIPDSDFWVVTNNDTQHKREVIRRILHLLNYQEEEINLACDALIPREGDSIL